MGLMTIQTYPEFKRAFDHEVKHQAESFIRMGYLLRVAQDTDILYESGYPSIAEFARAEYRLSADYVSRMIEVNKRYSDGGYSDRLMERYQGYGYTLLSEMLTLPEVVADALPLGTNREDIREIKREIREEQKRTDIEVMLEEPERKQQELESNLAKALHQYWYENRREYPDLFYGMTESGNLKETLLAFLAPSGASVKMIRVRGLGKFMLSIKGADEKLALINVRTGEQELYSWEDCIAAVQQLCQGTDYPEAFECAYGEAYESECRQIESSQNGLKKPASVDFAPAQIAPDKEKNEKTEPAEGKPEDREPVQQSIRDYPEVLPEGYSFESEVAASQGEEYWKEAAQISVRLFHTLELNDWNPDGIELVHKMRKEAVRLGEILEALEMSMKEE